MISPRGRPPKLPAHLRRSVVLDVATRQFANGGRVGTSVDDIASEAGVRKPAIYELFGSKDDLFRSCVDQAVQALRDNFRVVNAETSDLERPERTRRRVAAAVDYAERHPDSFRLLVRAPYSWPDDDPEAGRQMRDDLVEVMADNYRRESRAAGTPIDVAAEVVARLFFVMAEEVILLCLTDATWDRDLLVDFLAELIEHGISGVGPEVWLAMEQARTSTPWAGALAEPS
jgi:AcrR family transcriptional regulator